MKKAIQEVVRPGDTVIDVGTGTGVLAFLTLDQNPKRVYAWDSSPIIDVASRIKESSFPDSPVEFRRFNVRTGRLPKVKADVIICELLGQFAVDEGILPVVRRLRDRILKNDGRLIPNSIELMIAPFQDKAMFAEFSFWRRRRYDIDFTPLKEFAYSNVYSFSAEKVAFLSPPAKLARYDLSSVRRLGELKATFLSERSGVLHGIVGWFTARLSTRTTLSSDPRLAETHWSQILFPVGDPIRVKKGAQIGFELCISGDASRGEWSWKGNVAQRGRGGAVEITDFAFENI